MEARELRIGNWVSQYVDVDYVNDMQFTRMHFDIFFPINQVYSCKAIPLTEEWLVRFGFEKLSNYRDQYFINKKPYAIFMKTRYKGRKYAMYKRNDILIAPVKHVHQLQNLYFALTGEELTIKE